MYFARLRALIVLVFFVGLLASCKPYSPPNVLLNGSLNGVSGLSELLQKGDVKLIWVHGMCNKVPSYAHDRAQLFKRALHSTNHVGPIFADKQQKRDDAYVATYLDEVNGNVLESRYLMWSPLTRGAKSALATETEGGGSAALLNDLARTDFLQDCLADVVAYIGNANNPIQNWVEKEICAALGGRQVARRECDVPANTERTPIVVVSQSLGSKIVLDALKAIYPSQKNGDRFMAYSKRVADIRVVHMLANQISLLEVGKSEFGTSKNLKLNDAADLSGPSESGYPFAFEVFEKARDAVTQQKGFAESAPSGVTFVDYTDPNDILSARFSRDEQQHPEHFDIINVTVSNTSSILNLFANPAAAHCDYVVNEEVMGIITYGYKGGKVRKTPSVAGRNCKIGAN